MSFSSNLKSELCREKISNADRVIARLAGMLAFSRQSSESRTLFTTEHEFIAEYFINNIKFLSDVNENYFTLISESRAGKNQFTVSAVGEVYKQDLYRRILFREGVTVGSLPREFKNNAGDFIAGVFLCCGTISDPQKAYHVEFIFLDEMDSVDFKSFLAESGVAVKSTVRKNQYLLYLKESAKIEDLLTLMGAVKATFELIDIKIYKELRNKANRVTNFETANISKTVAASSDLIELIRFFIDNSSLNSFPEELRATVELRLGNPDASLSELVTLSGDKVSRSGLNHRLRRIKQIATDYKNKANADNGEEKP